MSYYDSYLYPKDEEVVTKRLARVIEQIQDQIDRAPLNIDSDNDEYNPTPYLPPFGGSGGTGTSDASNQKEAVRAATTANITLSGTQTVDGVALVADDRVLVKDQTDGTTNGIYIVKSGAAWTRSTDADSDVEILNMTVLVNSGDTYDNLSFLCTNDSVTLGTTSLEFAEFGSNYTDVDVLVYLNLLLKDGWTNITNFTVATQQWWIDSTNAAIAFVKGLATAGIAALNAFIAWLGSGTDIIDKIWTDLKSSYTWLKDTLQLLVDDIWGSLKGSYTWLKDTLTELAGDIWGSLKSSYSWLEDTLSDLASNIWGSLKSSYSWLENSVSAVAANIWTSLKSSYSWLSDTITGVVSSVTSALGAAWTWLNALDNAKRIAITAAATWVGSVGSATTNIGSYLSGLSATDWNSITNFGSAISAGITSALGAAWTWLNALDNAKRIAITAAATWVGSATTNIGSYLSGLSATDWNSITNFGSAISAGITSALGAAWTWLNALDNAKRIAITAAATWVGSATTNIGSYLSGLSATDWNSITNFGSAISAGITSALGAAWTWLNALDNAKRIAITAAATWVGSATTNIGSYLSGLSATDWNSITNFGSAISAGITSALGAAWTWLNALDNAKRIAITAAATWVGSATTNIGSYLSGLSATDWNSITNFGSAISAGITSALGAAWTWLNGLNTTTRTAITAAATWVADASAKIYNILSSGATSFLGAAQAVLFGSATPSAFAESEADGQITSSLSGSGAIKTKIDTSLLDAFTTFATDLGVTASTTFDTLLGNISSFLSGGSSGATKNLSNLENVSINEPLTFDSSNTSGSTNTRNIGYNNDGDFYIKLPTSSKKVFIQAGGVTQLEITDKGIKLYDDNNDNSDPTSNGEIKRKGKTIQVKVNDMVKDFANIGTGDGSTSGGEAFTTLTTSQTNAGAFWIPVKTYTSGTTSASLLDSLFGSAKGSMGVLIEPGTFTVSKVKLVIKMGYTTSDSPTWYLFDASGRLSSSGSATGKRYGVLSYGFKKMANVSDGSGNDPGSLNFPAGSNKWIGYYENDAVDARISWKIGFSTGNNINEDDQLYNASAYSGTVTALSDTIAQRSDISSYSVADTYLGIDDGYIGVSASPGRLYIKVDGYWHYWTEE